jgi:hypothetical protein
MFNEESSIYDESYKKTTIILLKDDLIYFTIIQDKYRLNTPVLTSHLFFKRKLKVLFKY